MEQGRKNVVRGCIKSTKGPWLVRRATKHGDVLTKYRFPSTRERLNNKQRERTRRSVTRKIFSGLRAHGNYDLPKHANSNDLLKAICEEAGWHVEDDGTIFRKHPMVMKMPKLIDDDSCKVNVFENEEVGSKDEEGCKCGQERHQKEPNTTLAL